MRPTALCAGPMTDAARPLAGQQRMTTTTGATAPPPLQTVGDALERARGTLLSYATDIVADDYPESIPPTAPDPEATAATPPPENAGEPANDLSQSKDPEEKAEPPAPEDEPEPEEEDAPKGLTPEVQERVNRRIGKEVAKTKAEREKRAALEAELAELRAAKEAPEPAPAPPARNADEALQRVQNPAELERVREDAENAVEQAETLLDQLDDRPEAVERELRRMKLPVTDEAGNEDYSPARIKATLGAIRRNAQRMLTRHIPRRMEFLNATRQGVDRITTLLPEFRDLKSPRAVRAAELIRSDPALLQRRDWPEFIAAAVLGYEALEKARAPKATEPKAKPPIPPRMPAAPKAAAEPKAGRVDTEALFHRGVMGGDTTARLAYIENMIGPIAD